MSQEFIKVRCPECQKRLKVPACKASRKIRCPQCETLFRSETGPEGQQLEVKSKIIPSSEMEIVVAELVSYGPGIAAPSRFNRDPSGEEQQAPPLSENPLNRRLPVGQQRGKKPTGDLAPESWWDATDLPPFETADANFREADQQREHSKRNGFFRSAKQRPQQPQTSPENPRQASEDAPQSGQDLGPCLVTCKRQTNLDRGVQKTRPDVFAWFCIVLLSLLFAFLAGLLSLYLLNLQTNFTMASNSQKILVIGIYTLYFLLCLSLIIYLTHRSTYLCRDAAVEARQLGVRINIKGRQFQIPYQQVRQVFRAPESDLSRLAASLLAGRGQVMRDSLVLETHRGKKICIPRCDEIFTAHSLTDVMMEINCRAETPATPAHQASGRDDV